MMQIAGTNCAACGRNIAFVGEGMGCPDCNTTYHQGCLGGNAKCPKCGRDLNEAKQALDRQADADKETARRLHNAGKIAVFSLIGVGFLLFRILELLAQNKAGPLCYLYLAGIALLLAGAAVSYWRALRKGKV